MANAFDSTNYETKEPTIIIAGDRVAWKRTDLGSDYDPASYGLSYSARREGSAPNEISISASESGSDYLVEVASTTSAAWNAGRYHWQAYITRTSDSARITIGSGVWEVIDNRDSANVDPRTHARITLENTEAAIRALSSRTTKSYSLNGNMYTMKDISELETIRDKYRAEVKAEDRKANGTGGGKLVMKLTR